MTIIELIEHIDNLIPRTQQTQDIKAQIATLHEPFDAFRSEHDALKLSHATLVVTNETLVAANEKANATHAQEMAQLKAENPDPEEPPPYQPRIF